MQTHDTLQRRNRYFPSSTGKCVTLKDRDRQWLELIARHGPLPSHYLHAAAEETHPNAKATRMRLTDLASETNTPHGGAYLTRPAAQRGIENARNRPLIYDLSEYGWAALGKTRTDTVRVSGPFRHQVMVSCVSASIELACRTQSDIQYIPADRVLAHPAGLAVDLTVTDPQSGQPGRHRLIPDQLFALAHRTARGTLYRAFVVECDRATEPVTSPKFARKSYLRSFLQYREFIGGGLYKDHYGLKSPLLVLNVMTSPTRKTQFQRLILREAPGGNTYMLFRTLEDFSHAIAPAQILAGLLFDPWERAGLAAISIGAASG